MTVAVHKGIITKRRLAGLIPFAFIVAFFVTCVITYPELIPRSTPFNFDELPFCDRDVVAESAEGNHTVLIWTVDTHESGSVESSSNLELCEYRNCYFTADRDKLNSSDSVIFNDTYLDIDDLPSRLPNQRWIFYSREAPPKSKLTPAFDGLFNWTMSYSAKDDVHTPFFTMCREGYRPPSRNFSSKELAAVWFVDRCYPPNLQYVNQLRVDFPVHTVGPCSPQGYYCVNRKLCMDRFLPRYKFALVMEDSLCTDFVTSHLRDILRYDVIPIVWGDADYSEILPKPSFITASEYSQPKELARMLYRFRSEEQFRKAINARRGVHAVRVDWKCSLCTALNKRKDEPHRPAYTTLAADRLKAGKCRAWRRGFFRSYRAPA